MQLKKSRFEEKSYSIEAEARLGTLFGIGNGYYGVRGSLEELGEVFIQGTYIRGVFDSIVEFPLTLCDNDYMKRFYFDVEKVKEFEREDSCINICDPLYVGIYVDGVRFLPWEKKLLSWDRYLDYPSGGLIRKLVFDDGGGHLTEVYFSRHCSFHDPHLILQEIKIRKINHDLPVAIELGVDTLVKTNGQHKSAVSSHSLGKGLDLEFSLGETYGMKVALHQEHEIEGAKEEGVIDNDHGRYGKRYLLEGKEAVFHKITSMYANIDPVDDYRSAARKDLPGYERLYKAHLARYKKDFSLVDVRIEGDKKADCLLRYANYQTLIGFDRFDSIHSLSAKNLTAEKYNQFVWWDAEIFELPFLTAHFPEAAKACLEYRYRLLGQSRKNAELEGYRGAKFAFCSSVDGSEKVWIYARHPFMQIHISADVSYGVYQYYLNTGDDEFMKEKGIRIMVETSSYFASRATLGGDGLYHLDKVTGTDEHHPYVNDNAYTNYEVNFIAKKALAYIKAHNIAISSQEKEDLRLLAERLYLPTPNKKGIIPQFDGYLSLKPYLEVTGNGAAKGFQMKQSGLYNRSQIIKQPDVLNLFTYVDVGMDESLRKANHRYYLAKCESSSSLTYPVHALSGLLSGDIPTFLENFYSSMEIDILDLHSCAYQGIHAGCLAGGWYNVYRGILGARVDEEGLHLDPSKKSPFPKVTLDFIYKGARFHAVLDKKRLSLVSDKEMDVFIKGKKVHLDEKVMISI